MPREALRDLSLAVLRYDQAVLKMRRDGERNEISSVPDLDDLYEEMLELAREGVKAGAEPRR